MADYGPDIFKVEIEHDGLPVRLKLRTRNDVSATPFHVLSWRTAWPSGKGNRKTYDTSVDGYWSIPVSVALDVLEQAEAMGMLDRRFDRHELDSDNFTDSRSLDSGVRTREFTFITTDDEVNAWGDQPIFVIAEEPPDRIWRKILIVDSDREVCTFRSTTKDSDYGMKQSSGMNPPWFLDRSMQDASSEIMRQFLQVLRDL